MNAQSRDLSLIAIALIAILGCGFGLGSVFQAGRDTSPVEPAPVAPDQFEEVAFANLSAALELSPEQEDAIRSELRETSDEIHSARQDALLRYHLHLLDFHDRIGPKLKPAQRETLREYRELLQDTIESRFGSSLDDLRASVPD